MVGTDSEETDLLRERLKEYRELLEISYHMLKTPETLTPRVLQKYLNKLKEHGFGDTVERGFDVEDHGRGMA